MRRGTTKAADYWALGVLIFEMLVGDPPFKSLTGDPWDTFRRTLSGRFYVPNFISDQAADLIFKLLQACILLEGHVLGSKVNGRALASLLRKFRKNIPSRNSSPTMKIIGVTLPMHITRCFAAYYFSFTCRSYSRLPAIPLRSTLTSAWAATGVSVRMRSNDTAGSVG